MSNFGIKISRPGYSVTDTTVDDSNIVISSELNTLKLCKIIKFDEDALRTTETKAHGLTYPPVYIGIKENGVTAGRYELADTGYFGGGISKLYADSTNISYAEVEECYVLIFTDALNE